MQTRRHVLVGLVVAVSTAAHADPAADIRAARDSGLVVHDGKGHYIVFGVADPAAGDLSELVFYGDGKTFYRQRIFSSETDPTLQERVWSILDDRMGMDRDRSKLAIEKGVYSMRCRDVKTPLTALDPKDARKLLAKAAF